MKRVLFIIYLLLFANLSFTQVVYYQDIFRGGVSVVGASSAEQAGFVSLPTGLGGQEVIKKIFFVCYGVKGHNFIPTHKEFKINNIAFDLEDLQPASFFIGNNTSVPYPNDYNGHVTYVKDITSDLGTIGSTVTIDWLTWDNFPPWNCPACVISAPLLVILYEDDSMPVINYSLVINDQNNDRNINLVLNDLNEPNFINPIALSIHSDRLGQSIIDGYDFYVNTHYAGRIINSDSWLYTLGSGAIGCFNYQNGVLTGLTDDDPDPIFYGSTDSVSVADGLATINGYIPNNQINPLRFSVGYIELNPWQHNYLVSYSLAYSTPCDTFSVNVSKDTILCYGDQLQLSASGGQNYEWSTFSSSSGASVPGLTCSNCSDPIFTADSSMFYILKIWNSEGCSVMRPIDIKVVPELKMPEFHVHNSICGINTGVITALGTNILSGLVAVNENGDTLSFTNNKLFNLSSGNYTVFYTGANGCKSEEQIVSVGEVNNVQASFTINPTSGSAPLTINVYNKSKNASVYQWFVNGVLQDNPFNSFVADTSGMYEVMLVAYNINSLCPDTARVYILVNDSLVVSIPNVITANGDGVNDDFSIDVNLPVHLSLSIFNRWGNEVHHFDGNLSLGKTKVWDGKSSENFVSDGTYFYKATFELLETETVNCENVTCKMELQGFVQVIK